MSPEQRHMYARWEAAQVAMQWAFAFEQLLSPWQRAGLDTLCCSAAYYRDQVSFVEGQLRERGWWSDNKSVEEERDCNE